MPQEISLRWFGDDERFHPIDYSRQLCRMSMINTVSAGRHILANGGIVLCDGDAIVFVSPALGHRVRDGWDLHDRRGGDHRVNCHAQDRRPAR